MNYHTKSALKTYNSMSTINMTAVIKGMDGLKDEDKPFVKAFIEKLQTELNKAIEYNKMIEKIIRMEDMVDIDHVFIDACGSKNANVHDGQEFKYHNEIYHVNWVDMDTHSDADEYSLFKDDGDYLGGFTVTDGTTTTTEVIEEIIRIINAQVVE